MIKFTKIENRICQIKFYCKQNKQIRLLTETDNICIPEIATQENCENRTYEIFRV